MELVRDFSKIDKGDVSIAGGKGASLGEMTKAGIPVPPGFIVLSDTFERFIKEANLNVEIDAALDEVNHEEMHTIEEASEKIQALITNAEMSKDIGSEIQKSFKRLDAKYVAVRSSATAEDSASAAWAGQLDTFLNIREADLLEHVKKCWASLFTPRAIFYRFEKKLHKEKISVAVVIQKMIDSEESGIAFSVHPVTQDENQLIIEAGFGLGEAIVSGQITPDSYVVDKEDWHIIDINVNEQTKGLYKSDKEGNEWKELGKKGENQVLNEKEIVELAKLIVKIEKHYGFPVDIEWAREKDEDKFYIVQSRPITTLSQKCVEEENLADNFLDTIKGEKIFQCTDTNIFPETVIWTKRQFLKDFYKDKTPLPFIIIMKGKRSVAYYQEEKWERVGEEFTKNYLTKNKSAKEAIRVFKSNIEKMNKLYSKYTYNYIEKQSLSELQKLMPELMSIIEPKFFSETNKNFCKKYIKDLTKREIDEIWKRGLEPICESFDTRQKRLVFEEILKGKSFEELREKFQYFFTGLTTVFNLGKTQKALGKKYNVTIEEAREKLTKLKKLSHNSSFIKWYNNLSAKQRRIVDFLQKMIEYRDLRKDIHTKGITIFYRIAMLKILKPLKIPEENLQYISYNELLKPLSYFTKNRQHILKRKKGYGLFIEDNGNNIGSFIDFDIIKSELDNYIDKDFSKEEIIGTPASKGKVEGRVRIITSIQEQFKDFKEGEILVTGMTRPGYVPLIEKSKAVVTDEGGATCHATIISRELSKPCIVGTNNATRILKTGDLVEVDADKGIVKIIKRKCK